MRLVMPTFVRPNSVAYLRLCRTPFDHCPMCWIIKRGVVTLARVFCGCCTAASGACYYILIFVLGIPQTLVFLKKFLNLDPNQILVQNSSTTIIARSSSGGGRPALSPRIEAAGLNRPPLHQSPEVSPIAAAKQTSPSSEAKSATVFHFTGTCLLHKLLSDGTVELIKNPGAAHSYCRFTNMCLRCPNHTLLGGTSSFDAILVNIAILLTHFGLRFNSTVPSAE